LAQLVVTQPENREAARTLLRAVSPSLLRVVRGILGAQHPDVPDVSPKRHIRQVELSS